MKLRILHRSLGCAAIAMAFGLPPLTQAEVEISYEDPESFSDMGDDSMLFDQSTFERFQGAMEEKAEDLAEEYLPSGSTLALEFIDVDLAGEVEPWIGRMGDNVRVLREIYPPRLKFHYTVTGEDGDTLEEGLAQLSDMNYLWGANIIRRDDPFYYEKELLNDWGRKALDGVGTERDDDRESTDRDEE